jgi:hypothetical protein
MRAFLSSTFWDLRLEREAALAGLEEFGHEVEAMEVFVAKPTQPLNAVLDNLRGCDFMVLLIGFRAGSVVPRRRGLTYTQAEYRLARRLKMPIFVFVKTGGGRWRNSEVTGSAKYLSLEKFHKSAIRQHLPGHFSSAKELGPHIVAALRQWDAEGRPGARHVFSTPHQFFRSQATGGTLLDYEQTLRGRSKQSVEFNRFLSHSGKIVALLRGRGGIGKTKLLRDWSLRLRGWKVLFVNDAAHWHAEAFKEVPVGKLLLVHDDAHRSEILRELSVLTRDLKAKGMVKLMLAYRPSGSHLVEATVSRYFGQDLTCEMTPLEQLSRREVRQLAAETLGPKFRQYAEALAIVSRDTPLVTVIGGKLIARRQVPASLLANEDAFRRTVFDRFIDEQQGRLSAASFNIRPLLHLLAAVTPIAPTDSRFLERAVKFLHLREDEILIGVDELVNAGVLLKGGSLVRIVPDVLSDFLLEQACVDSSGESLRFADAVYAGFGDEFLSNLLRNLGELDWRITQRARSASILNGIWGIVRARFAAADAFDRKQLLQSIRPSAIVQPAACLELVNVAISDVARPTPTSFRELTYEQKNVLEELPPILSGMAYHPDYTRVAMQLLWNLAKGREGSKQAAKALESFAAYGRYKSVFYNNAVAQFLEETMDDPEAVGGHFTLLDMADKLLAKEGDYSELEGMTFNIGTFILDYPTIAPTRRKVFRVVETALFSNSVRAGVRAVMTLERVVGGYIPRMRGAATAQEQKWQNKERSVALSLLEKRVATAPIVVPVLRQIRYVLGSLAQRGLERNRYVQLARAIADRIHSDDVDIFDAFISASWQFDRIDEKGDFVSGDSRRQQQVDHAIALIRGRCPEPVDKIRELEQLYAWATEAVLDSGDHLQFVDLLCKRDPEFRDALAHYIITAETASIELVGTLHVVLVNSRENPDKYRSLAMAAAEHSNIRIVRRAAASLFYLRPGNVIQPELDLLERLAAKSDNRVRAGVLEGLRWLAKDGAFRDYSIRLALAMDVEDDRNLSDTFCELFGPLGMGKVNLRPTQVRFVLDKLTKVGQLDGQNCHHLLMQWADMYPQELFDFFLCRIDNSLKRRAAGDWHYQAIPQNVSLRKITSGPELLLKLRSLISKFIESGHQRDIGELFWTVTVLDEATIALLEEYITTETGARALIALLTDAPRGIALNWPRFARRLLEAAEKLGKKNEAMSRLILNCQPNAFVGGAGSPALTGIRDQAAVLMKEHQSDPLLYLLYQKVKESIGETIKSLQVQEDDLRFEHS